MFAVRPDLQNAGLGKRFMAEAEALARDEWQASSMLIDVITLRAPLIAFYERRGYRRTGRTHAFPASEKFGIPKVDGLQLETLEKTLA
jgi:GNAT superfamily N-acetyltransferase